MESFRILHLSDFHFGTDESFISPYDLIKRLGALSLRPSAYVHLTAHDPALAYHSARLAYELRESIDVILISGDLARTGSRDDLNLAHTYLYGVPTLRFEQADGSPTLQAVGCEMLLMPGNHDRYEGFMWGPGGRTFDAVFADGWTANQGAQMLAVLEKSDERLAFVAADFSLRERLHADGDLLLSPLGQGRVYPDTLERLIDETELVRSEMACGAVVWAVHFAPAFEGIAPELQLLDDETLLHNAVQNNVDYLMCGHTHDPEDYTGRDSGVQILCAGSACECSCGHNSVHLRDFHVEDGRVVDVRSTEFFWNRRRAQFERK